MIVHDYYCGHHLYDFRQCRWNSSFLLHPGTIGMGLFTWHSTCVIRSLFLIQRVVFSIWSEKRNLGTRSTVSYSHYTADMDVPFLSAISYPETLRLSSQAAWLVIRKSSPSSISQEFPDVTKKSRQKESSNDDSRFSFRQAMWWESRGEIDIPRAPIKG